MEKYLPTLGRKLFCFRKLNGYTVELVERIIGIPVRRQRDLECGRLYPTLTELRQYAKLYDFSIDWFLEDLDEDKSAEAVWAEFQSSSEGFGEVGPDRMRKRMMRIMESMPYETQYAIARFVIRMDHMSMKKMCEELAKWEQEE